MNPNLSSEDMVRALALLQSPHKEESCACAWHPDNVTVEMMVSLIQQLQQAERGSQAELERMHTNLVLFAELWISSLEVLKANNPDSFDRMFGGERGRLLAVLAGKGRGGQT